MSVAPQNWILNKSNADILRMLQQEEYISEYNLEEKWYKGIMTEEEIRARWQQIIDNDVNQIRTLPDEGWRSMSGRQGSWE